MHFIINPKSGGKPNDWLKEEILKEFPSAQVRFTERPGHASELARQAVLAGSSAAVAVGGDGTINEVSSALVGTQTRLGIIPRGSGNGFSRELGISLNPQKAIQQLKTAEPVVCDTGLINGEHFINLAGAGIEAEIAHAFANHGSRGMLPYFTLGAKKFFSYKPKKLQVTIDGHTREITPLTLVFSNGRQYGSNFIIAPKAKLGDGFLDMVTVENKNIFYLLFSLPSFFFPRWPFTPCKSVKVKEAAVRAEEEIYYHADGEPRPPAKELHIKILPGALNVLKPKI